jgi:hypothetical protein
MISESALEVIKGTVSGKKLSSTDLPMGTDVFYSEFCRRKNERDPIIDYFKACLRKKCEEHLTPGMPEYLDWQDRKTAIWTERHGCRFIPRVIENLLVGGILFEQKYAEVAKNIIHVLAGNNIGDKGSGTVGNGLAFTGWRRNALDAGASAVSMALSFDLFRSMFPDQASAFGNYLKPFFTYLLENPPDPKELKPEHNIATTGNSGCALLGTVLYQAGLLDEEYFKKAVERANHRAKLLLSTLDKAGGAALEGPSYTGSALEYIALFAFCRARCGDRDLIEHSAWDKIIDGYIYELVPSGKLNMVNDSGESEAFPWLAQVAAIKKNGVAQWLWQHLLEENGKMNFEAYDNTWKSFAVRFILYYDSSVKAVPPEEKGLAKCKHFPYRDLIDVRTGWEPKDMLLSFICDKSPRGGHRQADRNHFSFYALGEAFAIDSAYGHLKLPDGNKFKYGGLGEAHNLPLINGEMQHQVPTPPEGIRRVELSKPFSFVEGEATSSHSLAKKFVRRLVHLPWEDNETGCLVVADTMIISDFLLKMIEHAPPFLSWLLHTDADNKIEIHEDRVILTGGRYGNRCLLQMIRSGESLGHWRTEKFLEHPRLRYDWFAPALQCLVVLVPFEKHEHPPGLVTQTAKDSCGVRISYKNQEDFVLSAPPGGKVSLEDVETDAEFALVRLKDGQIVSHTISDGTYVSVKGKRL